MKYWEVFWTASLLIAGASFAIITCVVALGGFVDVKKMLASLNKDRSSE